MSNYTEKQIKEIIDIHDELVTEAYKEGNEREYQLLKEAREQWKAILRNGDYNYKEW